MQLIQEIYYFFLFFILLRELQINSFRSYTSTLSICTSKGREKKEKQIEDTSRNKKKIEKKLRYTAIQKFPISQTLNKSLSCIELNHGLSFNAHEGRRFTEFCVI